MSWLEVAEKDGQPWYRHAVYCIRGRLFIGVLLSLSSSSNYGNAGGNDVMLYMRIYIYTYTAGDSRSVDGAQSEAFQLRPKGRYFS
jgi:hypothetical protein